MNLLVHEFEEVQEDEEILVDSDDSSRSSLSMSVSNGDDDNGDGGDDDGAGGDDDGAGCVISLSAWDLVSGMLRDEADRSDREVLSIYAEIEQWARTLPGASDQAVFDKAVVDFITSENAKQVALEEEEERKHRPKEKSGKKDVGKKVDLDGRKAALFKPPIDRAAAKAKRKQIKESRRAKAREKKLAATRKKKGAKEGTAATDNDGTATLETLIGEGASDAAAVLGSLSSST